MNIQNAQSINERVQAIVITGPTASGKTSLSLDIAEKLGGEIVSADSMQIYKYMDIGTAKPTAAEQARIKHHMLDIINPSEEYSVASYAAEARRIIHDIAARGKMPIIVGGTGLYISTLVENITYEEYAEDEQAQQVRSRIAETERKEGIEGVYRLLQECDAEASERIDKRNVRRVRHAVEMYHRTGMTLAERNERSRTLTPNDIDYDVMVVDGDRGALYERIDRRVDEMFEQGLVDEVRRVNALGMGRTARQAIGYKEILASFRGEVTEDEARQQIQQSSRNYAKRQLTWFRKPQWAHFTSIGEIRDRYGI